ncbi:endoplasmic reticulum resident protein 44-like isoform X2 [Corticium candelabrum]|uniref:endoplasmic reticulum resident protein 44-like isoform X2 n=1 Tax=Corticium candelabrum TaxID=121492 RepID=UPI002E2533B4|nr:endoplasmic reticulum resident protein 44-like isoform X2 [Corticium candelabrum]
MTASYVVTICILATQWSLPQVEAEATPLTNDNYDSFSSTNSFVFINFYADWCRFSQMLMPVWNQLADKIKTDYPERVVIGKVNCETEGPLAQKFGVTKYPTMKLVRHSRIARKEYRGQRSLDALVSFVQQQMADPVQRFESISDLKSKATKRSVIGYFGEEVSNEYLMFKTLADELRDHCQFFAGFGDVVADERQDGLDAVIYRDALSDDLMYTSSITDLVSLRQWALSACIPLVREITFENAEELTEEGLPFLLLFHSPDDKQSPRIFREKVEQEVKHEKDQVNFLVADGHKFAHPLSHLGKTTRDLPVLAIDSFRHMYLFPNFDDIHQPRRLQQFIDDLKSGKLHREFHHGPDPATEPPSQKEEEAKNSEEQEKPVSGEARKPQPRKREAEEAPPPHYDHESPPESQFKKIRPSGNRYTLLRDEL